MAKYDEFRIETYTMEDAALYWGEPNEVDVYGKRFRSGAAKKNSFQGTSNIFVDKTIEVCLQVFNITFNKIEFTKHYYLSSYGELFKMLKKFGLIEPHLNTYSAFREAYPHSTDKDNYLCMKFKIDLPKFNKITAPSETDNTNEIILPCGKI